MLGMHKNTDMSVILANKGFLNEFQPEMNISVIKTALQLYSLKVQRLLSYYQLLAQALTKGFILVVTQNTCYSIKLIDAACE